jgi:hypothetical protein
MSLGCLRQREDAINPAVQVVLPRRLKANAREIDSSLRVFHQNCAI